MPSDERLSLLLSTLAQVALAVELQPTLQILLDSLQTLVTFDAAGIFVRDAERHAVGAYAARGYPGDLELPSRGSLADGSLARLPHRLCRDRHGDARHDGRGRSAVAS